MINYSIFLVISISDLTIAKGELKQKCETDRVIKCFLFLNKYKCLACWLKISADFLQYFPYFSQRIDFDNVKCIFWEK